MFKTYAATSKSLRLPNKPFGQVPTKCDPLHHSRTKSVDAALTTPLCRDDIKEDGVPHLAWSCPPASHVHLSALTISISRR